MTRVKQRIYAGNTLDICIMHTGKSDIGSRNPRPRERFKTEEDRKIFNNKRAFRNCIRLVNENFTPNGYYITLTFDDENEIYNFEDARKIRDNFRRRIKYKCRNDSFIIFMGRGSKTARIHFHMIYVGNNIDYVLSQWKYGKIRECRHLREHNIDSDTGLDLGQDYSALVTYLWNHWTDEQGGQHCLHTRNMKKPYKEKALECKRYYSPEKPPKAPLGYKYIKCTANTEYGYQCFHYVVIPKPLEIVEKLII